MTPIELHSKLEAVPVASFLDYFKSARQSAFRLELLRAYNVEQEAEALKQFLGGVRKPPVDFNKDWLSLIKEPIARKVKLQRVRLVDEPISDYLRFEIEWGYSQSVPAGEEIRIIDRPTIDAIRGSTPLLKDFWLFDQKSCVFLEYDFTGTFLGLNAVPLECISPYLNLSNAALENSKIIQETRYWHLLDHR